MNKYKKNAEQSFVFCGTSSSLSGAKGKTLREHFFYTNTFSLTQRIYLIIISINRNKR